MDHRTYLEQLKHASAQCELAFEPAEYEQRIHRTREEMDRAGLDALLVTEPASVSYLSGYSTFETSVHTALLLPREGQPSIQVASIEVAPARFTTRLEDILGYTWEHPEQVVDQLAERLRRSSLARGRIGLEQGLPGLRPAVERGLRDALPEARWQDASGLVHRVRACKSAAELEVLRRAAEITWCGMEAALAAVAPGRQDNDVAAAAYRGMLEAGGEFPSMPAIVTSGHRSGWVHTCFRRVPLERGDAVFLELGGCYLRYTSPMMRTAYLGEPPPEVRRVTAAVEETVESLLEALRPGRTCHEVARDAARSLAPVADDVFFSGVFGYTVGTQFPPSWVEGSLFLAEGREEPLLPGMCFHLPICFRVPGRFGIGLSETVVLTETGCDILTRPDRKLHVVPAR